jgi:hypothetical protein
MWGGHLLDGRGERNTEIILVEYEIPVTPPTVRRLHVSYGRPTIQVPYYRTSHTLMDGTFIVRRSTIQLRYTCHLTLRHACPICLVVLPLSPITYSPCFTSYYSLTLLSGQLSCHFSLDIERRPTQCCPHHSTQYLISAVLEVVTMAMVGTTVVLPTVAPCLL